MRRTGQRTRTAWTATAAAVLAGLATGGALLVGGASAVGAPPDEPPGKGVRPQAAGVNEGTKRQASGVRMRPIEAGDPQRVLGTGGQYGGCTPGYGRGRACLPPTSRAAVAMGMTADAHPWTCRDVRELLPRGIGLDRQGADPLRLDTDGNGTACSAGD